MNFQEKNYWIFDYLSAEGIITCVVYKYLGTAWNALSNGTNRIKNDGTVAEIWVTYQKRLCMKLTKNRLWVVILLTIFRYSASTLKSIFLYQQMRLFELYKTNKFLRWRFLIWDCSMVKKTKKVVFKLMKN